MLPQFVVDDKSGATFLNEFFKLLRMKSLPFIVGMLFSSSTAFCIGASNGYIPKAKGKVPADELRAMLKSLGQAQCIYGNLGNQMAITEWDPEIFDVPNACDTAKAKDHRPICVGTVICHTPTIRFIVEKATCWANSDNECPPPSKCAQQSFVKSFDDFGAIETLPVYVTTEPARSSK